MTSQGPVMFRWRASLIALPLLAVLALSAWGFSSPVGSSPDDDFHLASIWCGGGLVEDKCEAGAVQGERTVARDLVIDSVCFAYQEEQSADCQGADFGTSPDDRVSTPRGNFAQQYPPVYYFVQSLFAGPNIEVSVALMRVFNSIVFVGAVTALLFLLPAYRRTGVVGAIVVSVVPLGMFIIPSTNPSGWAILSAALLWPALLGYFEARGRRRILLGVFAVLAALVGAGARSDAAVYVIVAVGVVFVITAERTRRYLLLSILPAALAVLAAYFYLTSGQSGVTSTGFENVTPIEMSPTSLFIANLVLVPDLWVGMFGGGTWGLGWLDTEMPSIVWASAFACFAISAFVGLARGGKRKSAAVLLVFIGLWLIPTVILVRSHTVVGSYLQPRYLLPIAIILAGVALVAYGRPIILSLAQRVFLVAALSVANSVALQMNLRRYVSGTDVVGVNLDSGAEWWWSGLPVSPMAVWVVGSAAFAALLVLLVNLAPPIAAVELVRAEPRSGFSMRTMWRPASSRVPRSPR